MDSIDLLRADATSLHDLIVRRGVTHCIHAAWYTDHRDYLTNSINHDWLAAGRRLIDACAAHSVRIAGLGTCFEYDLTSSEDPLDEEASRIAPDTLYAQCKVALSEHLAAVATDAAWMRVFYVYGPGDRAGRLVPHFVAEIEAGRTAEPRFGGLRRDFIHVDDLGRQIAGIALGQHSGPVNCATGLAPTLDDIAVATAAAMGRPDLAISNRRLDPLQPPVIRAATARLNAALGGVSARAVDRGVVDMIAAADRPTG